MPKKRSRKVNPRRIPMPKSMIDADGILEEATKDDMYHAWLLIFNALIEQDRIQIDELPVLADDVNRYIGSSSFYGYKTRDELIRGEKIMGISPPYENISPDNIKSLMDLERFKQKVFKIATHTALCIISLGLESTERFTKDELRHIFFNVDLTLSEIDHGCNSYDAIENSLNRCGLTIERIDDDFHRVSIAESGQKSAI